MSIKIKNNYKIFTVIGIILISMVLIGGLIFGPFNSILPEGLRQKLGYVSEQGEAIEVKLLVNFNNIKENISKIILFEENQTATAFSILILGNLSVDVIEYPNGRYIEGIDDVLQNQSHFWWYQADGVDGGVAADKFDLRYYNVKVLEWQYKTS